jgi:hypothetical protein
MPTSLVPARGKCSARGVTGSDFVLPPFTLPHCLTAMRLELALLLLPAVQCGYHFYPEGLEPVGAPQEGAGVGQWYGRCTSSPPGLAPVPLYYSLAGDASGFQALPRHALSASPFVALALAHPATLTLVGCMQCAAGAPGDSQCPCFFVTTTLATPGQGIAALPASPRHFPTLLPPSPCQPSTLACLPAYVNMSQQQQQQQHQKQSPRLAEQPALQQPPTQPTTLLAELPSLLLYALLLLFCALLLLQLSRPLAPPEAPPLAPTPLPLPTPPLPSPPGRGRRRRSRGGGEGTAPLPGRRCAVSVEPGVWGGESGSGRGSGRGSGSGSRGAPQQQALLRRPSSSLGPEQGTREADPVPLGGAFELLVANLVRQARAQEHAERLGSYRGVLGLHRASRAVFQP